MGPKGKHLFIFKYFRDLDFLNLSNSGFIIWTLEFNLFLDPDLGASFSVRKFY